jgi:hypothetical protein
MTFWNPWVEHSQDWFQYINAVSDHRHTQMLQSGLEIHEGLSKAIASIVFTYLCPTWLFRLLYLTFGPQLDHRSTTNIIQALIFGSGHDVRPRVPNALASASVDLLLVLHGRPVLLRVTKHFALSAWKMNFLLCASGITSGLKKLKWQKNTRYLPELFLVVCLQINMMHLHVITDAQFTGSMSCIVAYYCAYRRPLYNTVKLAYIGLA